MKTYCAWCPPPGRLISDNGIPDGKISHGACPECAVKLEAQGQSSIARIKLEKAETELDKTVQQTDQLIMAIRGY